MSRFQKKCGLMLGGLVMVTTTAAASADDKVEAAERMVHNLIYKADDFENPLRTMGPESVSLTECPAAVAAAEAAGLTGDSKLYPDNAYNHPNVRKDDKGKNYVTLDDVRSFCKDYDRAVIQEFAEHAVLNAFNSKRDAVGTPITVGMYPSEAEHYIKEGQTCHAKVDAALAAGFQSSHVLSAPKFKMEVKLGDAKAEYCQPVLDWGNKALAEINGAGAAAADEIVAVYAAVGIKGDRFKLFSSVGLPEKSGFLAPGCEKYVDTAKGLAKAKKLFTWFESDDGSIVVTKYTFKGNKYKESEKRYRTKAKAYRGCK